MTKDKTSHAVKPIIGSGTMVFGLTADDSRLLPLQNLDTYLIAADCSTINALQFQSAQIVRAICTLFPDQNRSNDAVSVLEALASAGFKGEVVVLAPPLLRPKMVENELQSIAKGMRLRLLAGYLPPLSEY